MVLAKATELNQIIGSKYIVMASANRVTGLDGWKAVADTLSQAAEKLKPQGIRTGYHNHQAEFTPLEGKTSHGSAGREYWKRRHASTRRRPLHRDRR